MSAGAGPPHPGGTELERLQALVARHFAVYETRVGPRSVVFAVHLDTGSIARGFDDLRRELGPMGYVPFLRYTGGEHFIEIFRGSPRAAGPRPSRSWINLALLVGTAATTTFAGALIYMAFVGGYTLTLGDFAGGALYFALPLMTILGLHELAHYLVARHYRVDASLPYFLPLPPPVLFGTMGAFVNLREPIPDRKILFDIGISGPLVGFAATIPILLTGLYLSAHTVPLSVTYCAPTLLGVSYGNLIVGLPLFIQALTYFFPSSLITLHPLALAGWFGVFLTAINLLPAGQLDGGHVFRALFGDRARFVSYGAIVLMVFLSIFYLGWLLFALLVFIFGPRHPPPLNDLVRLDVSRYALGALAVAILLTGIALVPLAVPAGSVALSDSGLTPLPNPPSWAHVAANLSVLVQNGDPVAHGFLFGGSVLGVTVAGPNNTTEILTGAALRQYAANSTWVFYLPNGNVTALTGGSVTTPTAEYSELAGGAQWTVFVNYLNPDPARSILLEVASSELCQSSGGTASVNFTILTLAP